MATIKINLTIITFMFFFTEIQQAHASCHWKEADLCLATLAVYGNIYGVIPSNQQQMEVFCRYLKESHECIRDFSRSCLANETFHSGYLLVQSTHLFYQDFCTEGTPIQKEWFQHAPCMAQYFNRTKHCSEYALAGIESLESIEAKNSFSTLCCVFNNIKKCMADDLSQNCDGNIEPMVDIVMKNMVSDVPNVACRSFDSTSKRCVDLLPPPGSKSKGKDSESTLVQLLAQFLSI